MSFYGLNMYNAKPHHCLRENYSAEICKCCSFEPCLDRLAPCNPFQFIQKKLPPMPEKTPNLFERFADFVENLFKKK